MLQLRKFVTPEFVFGAGSRHLAAQYAVNFGARKVLLVTDPGIVAAGWAAELALELTTAGLEVVTVEAVSPNPRAEEVMAAVEVYRSHGCDVLVAIGGGSPIDCAKSVSIVCANGGSILDYEGVDNVEMPGPPLICIPTTAGTGADISQFAIITDMERRTKIAIVSKATVPDVSLIDPETTVTMSPYLSVCTGLDAMVHAMEAFVSLASSPMLDIHALEAVRLIRNHLLEAVTHPNDVASREKVMRASLHAGIAFSNASLGAVHAMAHSLGGFQDLPHGESNAVLLEHVLAYNYLAAPERYDAIGQAMGLDLRGMTPKEKLAALFADIVAFKKELGFTGGLESRGVRRGDLHDLAGNALHDACMVTNPRRMALRDAEVVYEEAL